MTLLSPQVHVRTTEIGPHRHVIQDDHVVSVHTGVPVRVSCPLMTCVRSRGEINVFPAGFTEDTWFEDDRSDMIDVRLSASLLRLAAEEMGLDPRRADLRPRCHVRDPRIEHIAFALAEERRAPSPSGALYRESLGMALAVHLLAHHRAPAASMVSTSKSRSTRKTRSTAGLSPTQLARLTSFIDAHLADDLSLLCLARLAAVSTSHLRALFKRSMGVPVHEYVIQRRVERARVLLREGKLPASHVALESGFSHQSHMARCMRRVLGITPAQLSRTRP